MKRLLNDSIKSLVTFFQPGYVITVVLYSRCYKGDLSSLEQLDSIHIAALKRISRKVDVWCTDKNKEFKKPHLFLEGRLLEQNEIIMTLSIVLFDIDQAQGFYSSLTRKKILFGNRLGALNSCNLKRCCLRSKRTKPSNFSLSV